MNRLLCAVSLLALVACHGTDGTTPTSNGPQKDPPGAAAGASVARVTTPAPAGDVARVVAGINDLGFELYRSVTAHRGNAVLSPSSIAVALSMAYAGAAGATEAAYQKTLRSGLDAAAHHRAMNDLDRQLTGRSGGDLTLRIANQEFAQAGWAMEPAYLETIAREYGSGVRLLDFSRAAEPSTKAINAWVSDQTDGLIPELYAPGAIDSGTEFVLVNAILFKGVWDVEFDAARTHAAPFKLLGGSSANVQMMEAASVSGRSGVLDGVTVAALPYRGGKLSFVILMPAVEKFSDLEAGLTAARLEAYVAALRSKAYVSLPRFKAGTSAELVPALGTLGLDVFGGTPDYSRLTKNPFAFGSVLHHALIEVDEKGTVAAAATGMSSGGGAPSPPEHIVVDRPFVFLIRDDATGAVLFLGRMIQP
jgi:serpin B